MNLAFSLINCFVLKYKFIIKRLNTFIAFYFLVDYCFLFRLLNK